MINTAVLLHDLKILDSRIGNRHLYLSRYI